MGHELKSWFQLDARKLIWLIGIMFVLIIKLQYLEVPYGNVLSTSFHSGKVSVVEQSSFLADALSSAESGVPTRNVTHSIGLEHNGTYTGNEKAPDNEIFEERDTDLNNDAISETNVGLEISSTFEEGSPNESSTEKLVELNKNSAVGCAKSFKNKTTAEEAGAVNEAVNDIKTCEGKEKDQSDDFVSEVGLKNSSISEVPVNSGMSSVEPEMPSAVATLADMNNLFDQSRVSYYSTTPRRPSAADKVLLNARSQIENAPILENDQQLYAPIYRNVSMFERSYELMENTLKVYVYKEGKRPIFHTPVLKGIYASEGWFMKQLVSNRKFVTKKPREAQLFYIPFSSRMLEETLYVPDSHNLDNLIEYLKKYVDMIAAKYPFWNRTEGADHFLVACHDWAPSVTKEYMANCIRALCNSDIREGYIFGKDASLPETTIFNPQKPLRALGGKPPSKRSILAFFAGGMHGYLRPILLQH